ncbi:hypothetical protein SmJEL517_g05608 [Synchytrium microbalum]|uniref:Natural resistance-associated macrophage protein n=1 Tax=Synchytrium microbalum TaxID=1806994 RepID=A0A507BYR7_9FUNG|nr:uncharacterized protein SmJEL517_g05608 [Synchytrium microbalum]TPX30954.1 hypothetical protein SmJEL517_g05608 [Synchytrium microbalum]
MNAGNKNGSTEPMLNGHASSLAQGLNNNASDATATLEQQPATIYNYGSILNRCPPPISITTARKDTQSDFMSRFKRAMGLFGKFVGPGYLVAIGYFDPGNFATDLQGGSQFEYKLLFVVLLSNLMAVLLQSLCIKLGVVTGKDLASSCRAYLNPYVNIAFYLLCELAIVACDLAEVIGTAVALNLLFGLPLVYGVLITGLDVLIILTGFSAKRQRLYEFIIIVLVTAVALCFIILVIKSEPNWAQVIYGFVPTRQIISDPSFLYIAMGIVGATVMPHNLYLHSNIVMFRAPVIYNHSSDRYDERASDDTSRPLAAKAHLPIALHYTNVDSVLALTIALVVNSSILIVAGATLFKQGKNDVADLSDAHALLVEFLGPSAGVLFAVGLLMAGQSSTFTGTLAGQIVMEGFLGSAWKVPPWARRLITRTLAIIPAVVVAIIRGDGGVNDLLVLSQVILSLQLPFAVIPLVIFTSNKKIMTVKFRQSTEEAETESSLNRDDVDENEERNVASVGPTNDEENDGEAVVVAARKSNSLTRRGSRSSPRDSVDVAASWPPIAPTLVAPVSMSRGASLNTQRSIHIHDVEVTEMCYANGIVMQALAYLIATALTVFNVVLLVQMASGNT